MRFLAQLIGVPAVRPKSLATTKKAARKVSRAYGGNLCGTCVKNRITRAFLIEEQKIVKAFMKQRGKAEAEAKKASGKSGKKASGKAKKAKKSAK